MTLSKRALGRAKDFSQTHHRREDSDPSYGTICGALRSWGHDHGRPFTEGEVGSIAKRIAAQLRQSGHLCTDEALRKEWSYFKSRWGATKNGSPVPIKTTVQLAGASRESGPSAPEVNGDPHREARAEPGEVPAELQTNCSALRSSASGAK